MSSSLVLVTEKGIDDNGHDGPLSRPYDGLNLRRRPPAIGAPSIADPPVMKWAWSQRGLHHGGSTDTAL